MAFERARKVTQLPVPTEVDCIYEIATADPKVKHIVVTDAANVQKDLGNKTGFYINKKLFSAP